MKHEFIRLNVFVLENRMFFTLRIRLTPVRTTVESQSYCDGCASSGLSERYVSRRLAVETGSAADETVAGGRHIKAREAEEGGSGRPVVLLSHDALRPL